MNRKTSELQLLDRAPEPSQRCWINVIIAVVLIYQITVPLRFYTGLSGIDERFSWRFFSSVSLMRHEFKLEEQLDSEVPQVTTTMPLSDLLQVAVVKKLLNTHHADIIDAFLDWRVRQPGVREVRYDRQSTTTEGTALPPVHVEKQASRS